MARVRPVLLVAASLVLGFSGAVAAQQLPSALVLDSDGAPAPPTEPMTELNDGDTIDVAADAHMTVLHYVACKEIRVSGGRLHVRFDGYDWEGPPPETVQRPCAQPVSVPAASSGGGVTMRGGGSVTAPAAPRAAAGPCGVTRATTGAAIGPRPGFLVTGPAIADVTLLRLCDAGGRVVAEAPHTAGTRWTPSAAPLPPGRYQVGLVRVDGSVSAVVFAVYPDRGVSTVLLRAQP